jgi:hypothetical protein
MRYQIKPTTSYGVYDGERLIDSYASETTAQCVAEALNGEHVNAGVPAADYPSAYQLPEGGKLTTDEAADMIAPSLNGGDYD